jgi:hypothetical protein
MKVRMRSILCAVTALLLLGDQAVVAQAEDKSDDAQCAGWQHTTRVESGFRRS